MNYDGIGALNVETRLAHSALPAPGALVRVYGVDELNRESEHSRITGVDGSTGNIILPAPDSMLSLLPAAPERPYALYDVKIVLDGFYDKTVNSVAVFSGITTILPVNMIPISSGNVPRDTLNATSKENPFLE